MHKFLRVFIILIVLTSIILIITAIKLLNPPSMGGGSGNQSSSGIENKSNAKNEDKQKDSGNSSDKKDGKGNPSKDDLKTDGLKRAPFDSPFIPIAEVKRLHEPVYEILGKPLTLYLRCSVAENYRYNVWYPYSEEAETFISSKTATKWDSNLFQKGSISIKPIDTDKKYIPSVTNMVEVDFNGSRASFLPSQQVFAEDMPPESGYRISFEAFLFDDYEKLKDLKCVADNKYLELPFGLPERVIQLSKKITAGIDKPYLKIKAIKSYLKRNYKQSDKPNEAPEGRDAVDWFLFDEKKGSCVNFNSALVILSRCSGIPARLVTGYRVDPEKEYQIIYDDQLFIYGEVNFENEGWISFDATEANNFYTPPVSTITEVEVLDDKTLKGEKFGVKGTVVDNKKNGVDNLIVLIYLKKNKNDYCLSYGKCKLSNGQFLSGFNIDTGMDVGNYNVVAQTLENNKYRSSWSDPQLKVMSGTIIMPEAPADVEENKKFRITGSLKDKVSGKLLDSRKIILKSDNSCSVRFSTIEAFTDNDGRFIFLLDANIDKTIKPVSDAFFMAKFSGKYYLSYEGDEFYLPSEAAGEFLIRKIYYYRIFAVILVFVIFAAVIATTVLLVKKFRRKNHIQNVYSKDIKAEKNISEAFAGLNSSIDIVFPQIGSSMPDVWGICEELQIGFLKKKSSLAKENNYIVYLDKNYPADLSINEEPSFIFHSFKEKGLYEIKVMPEEKHKIEGERKIKIVDYREEIIELAKNLFKVIDNNENSVISDLTPRELGLKIKQNTALEFIELVDKFVKIFEITTYSLGEIKRTDYEAFYTSYIIIKAFLESAK